MLFQGGFVPDFDNARNAAVINLACRVFQEIPGNARAAAAVISAAAFGQHGQKIHARLVFQIFDVGVGHSFFGEELIAELVNQHRFSERGIFYAAVDNRVDDGGLAVVRGKTVHDSEHCKAYETQENRNYQPERLRFHAADAHFETFFHGHTRFNKSERFVVGNFYRVFVGGGKRLHFPVFVDVRRGFYVGVDLLVKRQIRLVPFKIFVDTLYVVGGQPVPFREAQKFPLVVFRATLFHFGVDAVFFDVGNYFAVFKFDHPIAVGLGKFAVVRNDDDKFVL